MSRNLFIVGLRRYLVSFSMLAFAIILLVTFQNFDFEVPITVKDHGVMVASSVSRGTVSTVDGNGRDVTLTWLFDVRAAYGLLKVDVLTGDTMFFPIQFDAKHDSPYASMLSTKNKYYTHFGNHFIEFDPKTDSFSLDKIVSTKTAMAMTESDDGVIYSATYPEGGLVSYNPSTHEFKDYGSLGGVQKWNQYPRSVAVDDKGWVYVGLGNTRAQAYIVNPATGSVKQFLDEEQTGAATYEVATRRVNGKVYIQIQKKDVWYEMYEGKKVRELSEKPTSAYKTYISGTQDLFARKFSDGRVLITFDLIKRNIITQDKVGNLTTVKFDYPSEGAAITSFVAIPGGRLVGGTSFPFQQFDYEPAKGALENHDAYLQWNTIGYDDKHVFVGGYSYGFFLDWDIGKPWVNTDPLNTESNPHFVKATEPVIDRPHTLLIHSNKKTIIMGGTPAYGKTGGGLHFWNRVTNESEILDHTKVLSNQSTMSMIELDDKHIIAGTTTDPGTGGIKLASQAELYIMDIESKDVVWHEAVIPGAQRYLDLVKVSSGKIFGYTDQRIFFIFDPIQKKVIFKQDTSSLLGATMMNQNPRVFVHGYLKPTGAIEGQDGDSDMRCFSVGGEVLFVLYQNAVAQIDTNTYKIKLLAKTPHLVSANGSLVGNTLYFGAGSHMLSLDVPANVRCVYRKNGQNY